MSGDQVVTYERNLDPETLTVTWANDGLDPGAITYLRPARFWNAKLSTPSFTDIYAASSSNGTIKDSTLALNVFPGVTGSVFPSGPPSVRKLASSTVSGDVAAFALFSDGSLKQSYFPSTFWNDFPVNSVSSGPVPNGAPSAIQRSADTDSVWYACGSGAQFCEIRLSPPSATNSYVGPATGTADFGAGTFSPNTRPTAVANVGGDGSRWVFAVVDNGTARSIIAKRDNNALTAPSPDYSKATQTFTVDSGTTSNVTFSSAMPYVNSAGQVAVVYFRTGATGTAAVFEKVWNGSTFAPSSTCNGFSNGQIHDTGVIMGSFFGQTEPVPSVAMTATAGSGGPVPTQNSILYRLPTSDGGYQDTVELRAKVIGSSLCYLKASVPSAIDMSGLYVAKASDSKLYRVEAGSAVSTALSNTWTGVTSFTSDRLGLGYIVQNNGLWEINLQDGARHQLATGSDWSGATQLAFGLEYATGNPTLWAFQNNTLYKVDLAAGTRAPLTSASCPNWTTPTAMAYLNYAGTADRLFAVNRGSLWRINSDTGACTAIGNGGEWTFTNAMAGDPNTNMLYIDRGANATSSHHINSVFPNTGIALLQTSSISAVTAMVSLNGSVYAIKAGILYRLTPSTMHLTALSSAAWTGTVFMASRTWESALPSTSPHGCDRDPSNPFREGCYGQNLIQSPSNFESFQWTTYHATAVAGGFGAPDATSTGELLREDATRHSHSLYQDNIATPSTIAYDWTVYVKMTPAANRSAVWFELGSSSDPTSYVRMIADLSTGTIASSSVAGTSTYLGGSIRPVINGWYQITLTGIPTGTSTDNIYAQIGLLQTATGALSYTGDGSSGVYIWGSSLVRD